MKGSAKSTLTSFEQDKTTPKLADSISWGDTKKLC